jgi:hypothetical protein
VTEEQRNALFFQFIHYNSGNISNALVDVSDLLTLPKFVVIPDSTSQSVEIIEAVLNINQLRVPLLNSARLYLSAG